MPFPGATKHVLLPPDQNESVMRTISFWKEQVGVQLSPEEGKEAAENIIGLLKLVADIREKNGTRNPDPHTPCRL